MANLTKIILGLNILAGGAGIFFGITKSGQASELVEKAKTAVAKATAAQGKVTGLENDKKDLTAKFSTANSSAQSLQTQLEINKQAMTRLEAKAKSATLAEEKLDKIKDNAAKKDIDILTLQADKTALGTQLDSEQRKNAALEAQLLELKAPNKPKDPQKRTVGTNVRAGNIVQQNPNTGSIILNIGTVHGIKVEDQFDVFRNNKHIGRIKVSLLGSNPNLSIAQRTEALGVPKDAQFKTGDELFRFQPK